MWGDYNMQTFPKFFLLGIPFNLENLKQVVFWVHVVGTSVVGFSCHRGLENIREDQLLGQEEAMEERNK